MNQYFQHQQLVKWLEGVQITRRVRKQYNTNQGTAVSVRKVVPTLTSKSAEIYLSMAGAKQHNDTDLSWFRSWAVRPARVRSGRCIALHRGAYRGELQARRERREASRSLRFD
jgi:hypothetical protein